MNLLNLCASQGVSVEAGDAEVAAQMEQIDGAQVPRDGDQGEAGCGLSKDNRATKIRAVHDYPDIRGLTMRGATGVGGGDDVLPAAQVIGLADGFDLRLIYCACRGETEEVDADAIELVDGLLQVGIRVGHNTGSGGEHVAVKTEAGLCGGLRLELSERRRNPVENDRAGVVLRVNSGGRVGRALGVQCGAGGCGTKGGASGKTQNGMREELHGYSDADG